jgi:hypothetical protein
MCWVLSFLIICLPRKVDFKLVFNFCSVSSRNWLNRIKTAFVRFVPIVVEFCCLLTIVCFVIEWLINDNPSNLAATSLKWKPCKHLIEVPLSKTHYFIFTQNSPINYTQACTMPMSVFCCWNASQLSPCAHDLFRVFQFQDFEDVSHFPCLSFTGSNFSCEKMYLFIKFNSW